MNNRNAKLYDSFRWRRKTSPLVRTYNPQCQRLFDDGTQCGQPSAIVHHLIDPSNAPQKAHDWRNLVATCAAHHPGGQRGETMGYRYCATCGPLNQVHFHKGGLLPTWHRDYVAPLTASISRLAGTDTSAIEQSRIDAALGTQTEIDALLDGV
jgi:hypothetical protein